MSSNPQLLYALLSMDVYHRGVAGGLLGVVPDTQIDSTTRSAPTSDKTIGFFAQSYTYNGATIIVYRGTDDGSINFLENGLEPDSINGYSLSIGLSSNPQARAAIEFYQTFSGTDSPATANIILVGQSLGGGLAGYVGALGKCFTTRSRAKSALISE